ncbi:MAG: HAD-IA family hydrolase [Taibaiella sp.]|nr:HAD-IA family hydrolase [Taibaiella sp.]
MVNGIDNIIFDLGGVILDIDYQKSTDAFRALGIPDFEKEFSQAEQSRFFERFEKGEASEQDLFDHINNISSVPLHSQDIIQAWNAMLLRIPLRRLQILQQLQLHYNTFLLSNTNSIHEAAFNRMLKEVCGFQSLAVFFDKVYYSHYVGMRKPDTIIFRKILDDHQIAADRTLFIDDSPQHIASAASLGLKTLHLLPGMTIEEDVFRSKNV